MYDYTMGSTAGRWWVGVPPQTSRRLNLRIVKLGVPNTPGEPDREVSFQMTDCAAGDFAGDQPALTGTGWPTDNDVLDFMRAVVQEAAKLGIVAEGTGQAAELKATRHHLDDMRALVFGQPPAIPLKTGPR